MELRKYYDPLDREWVAGWINSEAVAEAFCGLSKVTDRTFEDWLAAQDQLQFVLANDDGEPEAYCELWLGEDEKEVELAHLLVSDEGRGAGTGSEMVRLLVERVFKKMRHVQRILARTTEENSAAAGTLSKALFVPLEPVPEDWSDEFNWFQRVLER
ncbi:GNAT family N-acetyltransferase [bacterium]|nr:GNAT family N-acetyltransferase [bacterium]